MFLLPMKAQNEKNIEPKDTTTYLYMDSLFQQLPEVLVKGERPIAKMNKGTLVYDLPRLIEQQPADNAFEALTKLPGVRENDDVLTLINRNVTILLNGKPTTLSYSQLVNRLKSISSSQVVSAEVMLSAPARYKVRGAVINLITKDNLGQNNLTGELQSKWTQAHASTLGEQGSFILSRKKFSVDMFYAYTYGNYKEEVAKEAYHLLDDNVYHLIIDAGSFQKTIFHSYRTGFDYDFSKNHRLSIVYNGEWYKSRSHNSMKGNEVSDSWSARHEYLHNVKMDYEVPFGLKAGMDYTYFDNPQDQILQGSLNETTRDLTSNSGQRINKWLFYLSQEHSLKNGWGLNYGAKLNLTSNKSYQRCKDAQGNQVPESNSTSNIDEKSVNFYAGFNKSFGDKFSVDASLAAEYYHTNVWNDWNLFPTLNATYRITDGNLIQLSFSSDRTYPSYWSTFSNVFYSGAYTEVHGNPLLRPASDYQLTLSYTLKSNYTFALFWDENSDFFVQLPYQSPERLALIMKETNFNYRRNIGAQISTVYKIGKWMNGNVFIYGLYDRDKSDDFFDIPFDLSKFTLLGRMTTTLNLCSKPDIKFTLDGFYQSKSIQGIYDIDKILRLNSSMRWQSPNKRMLVTLALKDMTNNMVYTKVNYKKQWNTMKLLGDRRQLLVTFIYRMGNYKVKKRDEVDTSRMGH